MARSDVDTPVAVARVISTAVITTPSSAQAIVQPAALIMAGIMVGQAINGGCAPR